MSAKPIRTALDDLLASPGWSIEERPEIPGARIRHDSGLYLDLPPDLFTGKRPNLAGPLAAALRRAVERGITGATWVAIDSARDPAWVEVVPLAPADPEDRGHGHRAAPAPAPVHYLADDLAARLDFDAALVRLLRLSSGELSEVHLSAGPDPADVRGWLRAFVFRGAS